MDIPEIKTEELVKALDDSEITLVDVRPSAAYNGWPLKGEGRGGHIPGAVNLALDWVASVEDEGLKDLLAQKGIHIEKQVIVYGYTPEDAQAFAKLLVGLGYPQVQVYAEGYLDWVADESHLINRLSNYKQLVHLGWLKEQLAVGEEERPLILEAGFGEYENYLIGHIPGAIYLDTAKVEQPPIWLKVPDEALFQVLSQSGIRHDKNTVVYGRDPMAAMRVAVILMYAGVENVRVLDGGFNVWVRAGYALEKGERTAPKVDSFGRDRPGRPDLLIDIERVKQGLESDEIKLVSVRSWEEYIGHTSGYVHLTQLGRIAKAIWGFSGTHANQLEDYRNKDDTMRGYPEIKANWEKAGIEKEDKVVFYCGSGWRASEAFFYAHLMGWEKIAVYDGGWGEWSSDLDNPIEAGEPK